MMSSPQDQFKVTLNQNLWGLIVGLGALGASEYYELCTLFWFSVVVSLIMVVSISFTTFSYTRTYWRNKEL